MTTLRFEDYPLPSADLGEESPLPDIHVNAYIRAAIRTSDRLTPEDARYIGRGMISTLLPYRIQDGYKRDLRPRTYRAAILENEALSAVFLPQLGGRLLSLFDKREGRELLYKNDVFRPANLALRNAWFSGGVEWNVGIKGHNPLTASPLFACRAEAEDGSPILVMYEYERIRRVVFRLEATLVGDALLVTVTVENPGDEPVPMYWWSNIAVPETARTRVLAPADDTFFCAYSDGAYFLDKAPLPILEGKDITYATSSSRSRDFFFDIPKTADKWVASVDETGRGLLHFSDPLLLGRKMFVWGTHPGGRHWNEWLTENAGPYVEIQAGLLKTQLEHFPMPAKSRLSFRECYTALRLDPTVAHGDFKAATAAVASTVRDRLGLLSPSLAAVRTCEPPVQYGSGWGAYEERLRGVRLSEQCCFPEDSLGPEQADWLALLDGYLPPHDPQTPPESYAVGREVQALLEALPERDFYAENLYGVVLYAAGDVEGARNAFLRSLSLCENAFAMRNLAMIEKNIDKEPDAAAERLIAALTLLPTSRHIAVETAETLLSAGRAADWVRIYATLPPDLRENGRLRMLLGGAYAEIGDLDAARAIITADLVVSDIKEGEYSLFAIWMKIYRKFLARETGKTPTDKEVLEKYPLPYTLDFRMH